MRQLRKTVGFGSILGLLEPRQQPHEIANVTAHGSDAPRHRSVFLPPTSKVHPPKIALLSWGCRCATAVGTSAPYDRDM